MGKKIVEYFSPLLFCIIFLLMQSSFSAQTILNGGFELGTTDHWSAWAGGNASVDFSIVTDTVAEGSYACKVYSPTNQNYIGIVNDITDSLNASGSGTYILKAQHYYANGFGSSGKIDIVLDYTDGSGTHTGIYFFGTNNAGVEGTSKWISNQGQKNITVTGTVTQADIRVYTYSGSGTAPFYIDDVEFNKLVRDTIIASAGINGSISPSGTVLVNQGSDQAFTITPDSGYVVDSVLVDGTFIGDTSSYTFLNVTSNHTISVTFKKIPDFVNGGFEQGKIGWQPMDANSQFTIESNIVAVGDSAAEVFNNGYNYIGITNDVTDLLNTWGSGRYYLKAQHYYASGFGDNGKVDIRLEYTDAGGSHTIYFFGTETAGVEGTSQWISNEGQKDLTIDGTVTNAIIRAYTYSGNGTAPFYVDDIQFYQEKITQYTITATAGTHGSISPSGAVLVEKDSSKTFTFTPDSGYVVDKITVDGISVGSATKYTFSNVSANHTISVSFKVSVSQPVSLLKSSYSGNITWDGSTGTVNFTSSGTIRFATQDTTVYFIWQVPDSVKKIIIDSNVTVTGAFHFYNDCTIMGQNRHTSVIYGTPMQSWGKYMGVDAKVYEYCTLQTFGGTLYIKNLTSLDPFAYHIRGWGIPIHVSNCDFIDDRGGSGNHSDGFCGGNGSTVDSCYFSTGDDVIKVYFNMTITNTTINMIQNSVPIQFGWGSYGDGAIGIFKNDSITGTSGRAPDDRIIAAHAGTYTKQLYILNSNIKNPNGTLFNFMDSTANISVMMGHTNIDVKNFKTQLLAKSDIYIDGSYYDNSTTQSKWTVTGSPDTVAPVIKISIADTSYTFGDTIFVNTQISDNLNQIYRAELYMDGKLIAVAKSAPYNFEVKANSNGEHSFFAKGIDADLNTGLSDTLNISVHGSGTPTPYLGKPFTIPAKIEAEDFDLGGEGVAYHVSYDQRQGGDLQFRSSDAPNVSFGPWSNPSGGESIAWIADSNWFNYSIDIPDSAYYKIYMGYSSPNDSNIVLFKLDGNIIDSLMFNHNADIWNVWSQTTDYDSVSFPKGEHMFQVYVKRAGFNFDYVNIVGTATGVNNTSIVPKVFSLDQNYPNPFNPSTIIRYSIAKESRVTLQIYNILGQQVKTLVNKEQTPGTYNVEFNAANLASGIYFYRLKAGDFNSIKKMLLLK